MENAMNTATILIVDDEPEIVQILKRSLTLQSHTLFTAANGLEAVDILNAHPVDILVTDLRMSGMDGLQLLSRASEIQPEIQSIVITGHGDVTDAIEALNRGAVGYLMKPPRIKELKIHIGRCLEKIRMQQALRAARDQALAASRAKSEFLATMSHEIRTPMNAVMGLTDLALQTSLTPKGQDYLIKVANASRSLLRIINDILDFSKIEAGKLVLEPVDFLLRDVFDHLSDLFRNQAAAKDVELIMQVADECRYALTGDYLRIEQILMNLVGNALKFTEEGEVEVGVKLTQQTGDEVVLEFFVRDTGIGLSQAQIDTLFAPFIQADNAITRQYGGTGLGLTICRRLVEIMAGRIWAESTPGGGSVFRFTVALQRREAAEQDDMLPPQDLQRLRVLLVDDNPVTQNALRAFLDIFTFVTTALGSGREAVAAVQQGIATGSPYQLVLVDWLMPELDGIETARQILEIAARQESQQAGPPPKIILLIAFGREEAIKLRAREVGVNTFLAKPVNCSLLFDTVMELFGKEVTKIYRPAREAIDMIGIRGKVGGARVLLVEDNALNQLVARKMLENLGLFVAVAGDGLEANRMVMEASFDLVLMDIQMPIMDGYSACRQIRGNPRFKNLPIIAMTAHAMAGDRQKCLDAGMNDHMAKPIDRKQLYAALLEWIKPGDRPRIKRVPVPKRVPAANGPQMPATLPGIDVAAGLDRLDHNHRLFRFLLFEFGRGYIHVAEKIRAALTGNRRGDTESARQLVHTVKGMAGNLSAQALYDAALVLEEGIKEGRRGEWPVLLRGFESALQQVLQSITGLQPDEEEAPTGESSASVPITPLQIQEITPQLMALANALRGNKMSALKQLRALKPLLKDAGVTQALRHMQASLEMIDFEKAQGHLAEIFAALGISQEWKEEP